MKAELNSSYSECTGPQIQFDLYSVFCAACFLGETGGGGWTRRLIGRLGGQPGVRSGPSSPSVSSAVSKLRREQHDKQRPHPNQPPPPTTTPTPSPEAVVGRGGAGRGAGGALQLRGHTRRLLLINSDVRNNKHSADPANSALFYLIFFFFLAGGRGG